MNSNRGQRPLLLSNALAVATMDDRMTVLERCDVLVQGRQIKAVGSNLDSHGVTPKVMDCTGHVVIPGLVNTHHHLFQTLFRAVPEVQDSELFPWLTHLYGLWKGLDEDAVRVSAKLGMAELLLTGCTTTADHFYPFPRSGSHDMMAALFDAAARTGIRFHASRGSMSVGKSQGGLPPDELTQDEDVILSDCERAVARFHDPSRFSMTRVILSPCSPFSVSPSLMEKTAALARRLGVRMHTHLAETLDEEKYCLERFGKRPLKFVEELGWTGGDVSFAHGIHFDDSEIELLGKTRTAIAHCPSSNMRLGSGAAPVIKLLDAGAVVGIAVDGSASNDSSDMLGEVRQAMLLSRLSSGVGSMPAMRALRMATRGGAELLGRDDIGVIAPGMAADLIAIDMRRIGYAGAVLDPVAAVLFAGDSHLCDLVIVNGSVRVEGGRLVDVDETELVEEANATAARLIAKAKP